MTKDEFIEKATNKFNGKFDYSKVDYKGGDIKVRIICPTHGEFEQTPINHLLSIHGCPECAHVATDEKRTKTTKQFIDEAVAIHGDKYDYSKVEYKGAKVPVNIRCIKHDFWFPIMPTNHIHIHHPRGCPICSRESTKDKLRLPVEKFIEKANIMHDFKYNYDKVNYVNNSTKVTITCPIHGDFDMSPLHHVRVDRPEGCPYCRAELTDSKAEKEIRNFIKAHYKGKVLYKYRGILCNRKEVDIYLPELKLAIEYDGLYWHGDLNQKLAEYHLIKTQECLTKGIRLIHIFEDEWVHNQDIVKSILLSLINETPNTVNTENCEVKVASKDETDKFFNNNHIKGKCDATYSLGLNYNGEIVSLMAFGNVGNDSHYELIRFCNKLNTNVINAPRILLKYFIEEVKPKEITLTLDRRWEDGKAWEDLGFTLSRIADISYDYVYENVRYDKDLFTKETLIEQGYDPNKTVEEIMKERRYYKIYNCGFLKYKMAI